MLPGSFGRRSVLSSLAVAVVAALLLVLGEPMVSLMSGDQGQAQAQPWTVGLSERATAAAAASAARPMRTAASPDAAPGAKAKRLRLYGIAGQAYLAGSPLTGAAITVTTTGGRRLRIRHTQSKVTDGTGAFQVFLAERPPTTFVVTATGGRLGGRKVTHVTLRSFGTLARPQQYLNMASTLLVRYRSLHTGSSLKASATTVARYLGFPRRVAAEPFRLGLLTHLRSAFHDPFAFYRRATRAGGVNPYLKRLAPKVRKGQRISPSLVPTDEYVPAFGTGSRLFSAYGAQGQPAAQRTGESGGAQARVAGAKGLWKTIADLALDGAEGAVEWAAGNAAETAACAEAHSGITQGILGCNSTQAQLAAINATLQQMQQQITTLSGQVSTIESWMGTGQANKIWDDAAISGLIDTMQYTVAYLQVLKQGTPATLTVQGGWSPAGPTETDIQNLCDASYPTNLGTNNVPSPAKPSQKITVAEGQTPNETCVDLGYMMAGYGTSNSAPPLGSGTSVSSGLNTFFTYFAGYDETAGGAASDENLLIWVFQQQLMGSGTTTVQGMQQNRLNQTFASMVVGQASLFQSLIAWQSWYESWTTGINLTCQPSGQPLPATVPNKMAAGFNTSCQTGLMANWMLSVEVYMANNGARATMPSWYAPETQLSATTPGVVLDTVASQTDPLAWWAYPVDQSGQSKLSGNPYYPYIPIGPQPGTSATTGYNNASGVLTGIVSYAASGAQQILNAYPDTFAPGSQGQLGTVINDVKNAHISDGASVSLDTYFASAGFQGVGQASYMWWESIVPQGQGTVMELENNWPGTPGSQKDGDNPCAGWPTFAPYQAIPGYVSGDCTVFGYWSGPQGVYVDTHQNSTAWQTCPKMENIHGGGQNTCTGPLGSGDPSYITLLYDTTMTRPVWTQSMVTSWNAASVPSLMYQRQYLPTVANQSSTLGSYSSSNGTWAWTISADVAAGVLAPSGQPTSSANVFCQWSNDASFPTDATVTLTVGTATGGTATSQSCSQPALAAQPAGTTVYWRFYAVGNLNAPAVGLPVFGPTQQLDLPGSEPFATAGSATPGALSTPNPNQTVVAYTFEGTASASGIDPSATAAVECRYSISPSMSNAASVSATPATVTGTAATPVTCASSSGLAIGEQYYWQVSVTQSGATSAVTSGVVPFVTPGVAPVVVATAATPSPAPTAGMPPQVVMIGQAAGSGVDPSASAAVYCEYGGSGLQATIAASPAVVAGTQPQPVSCYVQNGLTFDETYYWQLVASQYPAPGVTPAPLATSPAQLFCVNAPSASGSASPTSTPSCAPLPYLNPTATAAPTPSSSPTSSPSG